MIDINIQAPQFSLPDDTGALRSIEDFKGSWVILYFYPKDDTPGCTKEACAFRDNFPFFEDTGLTVIGISKDSPQSHKKFKEKYKLPFVLLSDTSGSVLEEYEADGTLGTKRISYLIDDTGMIRKIYKKVDPINHAEEVLKDYKELSK